MHIKHTLATITLIFPLTAASAESGTFALDFRPWGCHKFIAASGTRVSVPVALYGPLESLTLDAEDVFIKNPACGFEAGVCNIPAIKREVTVAGERMPCSFKLRDDDAFQTFWFPVQPIIHAFHDGISAQGIHLFELHGTVRDVNNAPVKDIVGWGAFSIVQ